MDEWGSEVGRLSLSLSEKALRGKPGGGAPLMGTLEDV